MIKVLTVITENRSSTDSNLQEPANENTIINLLGNLKLNLTQPECSIPNR